MPQAVPLVPVNTNPQQWTPNVYQHIMNRALERKVPDEFWAALKAWGSSRPHARPLEDWYKELGPYSRNLQGWRLVGKGDMPTSILGPQQGYSMGRKLAEWLDDFREWHL